MKKLVKLQPGKRYHVLFGTPSAASFLHRIPTYNTCVFIL